MTLLAIDLAARQKLVEPGAPWFGLAESLAADLAPLRSAEAPIPETKARLTRIGGRCALDGTLLHFDPWSPHAHQCRQCGASYRRPEDHEWWAMGANLWTAERAVHAAALHVLRSENGAREIAVDILDRAAQQYLRWPNRDNVLGPTRPFFSTYLESIWLLNLCHALALLESGDSDPALHALGERVREQLIVPSLALIAQFDEGLSNRQVWNEVAILSALRMLGRSREFETRAHRSNGFLRLLSEGLLADGSWYEGENYHQFAHRGLWYGVQLFDAANLTIPAHLRQRYAEGFVSPFLGLLPDECFPSRRDSQYRVSIRQWRFAEWCELGITERKDGRLVSIRQRLYDNSTPRRDTGRNCSTADAERNQPPTALTRADCSWRALLMASGDALEQQAARSPDSVLLESQGLAVIRRDVGRTYVALEGGHSGGGHGHPDRLALTLQCGASRLLEDPGTGSYVERRLHWYRSTLAHFAPLVDRRSQQRAATTLVAFEDRGGVGWMVKRARIAADVVATRSVVVCNGYLVDLLEWSADNGAAHELTLPLCADATVELDGWTAEQPGGSGGLEDGFDFVERVEVCEVTAPFLMSVVHESNPAADAESPDATLWVFPGQGATLVRAMVPSPPGRAALQPRYWLRTTAVSGRVVSCWNWDADGPNRVVGVTDDDEPGGVCQVETQDGTLAKHFLVNGCWRIDLSVGAAISSIDLDELRDVAVEEKPLAVDGQTSTDSAHTVIDLVRNAYAVNLGEQHYRRTDESWSEAGGPSAAVTLRVEGDELVVEVDAATGPVVAPHAGADNPLDNERADVNASGVQLYIAPRPGAPWSMGWLVVPTPTPRISGLVPGCDWTPDVQSFATPSGWRLSLRLPLRQLPAQNGQCAFDLVVNERPAGRERRRGQLVLSGGTGFAYLRGDRHDSAQAILIRVASSDERDRETTG